MAAVSFILRRTREDELGRYPIYIQIVVNRTNTIIATGISVPIEDFSGNDLCPVLPSNHDCAILNAKLAQKIVPYITAHARACEDGTIESITASMLSKIAVDCGAQQSKAKSRSLHKDNFNTHFERFVELKEPKTQESYNYVYSVLMAFIKTGKHSTKIDEKNINYTDIDYRFVCELVSWMKNVRALSKATRSIVLRSLRALYNDAIKSKIVSRNFYPFEDYKIESGRPRMEHLPEEAFRKLIELDFSTSLGHATLDMARDMFLLSYLMCGINLKDLFFMPKQKQTEAIYQRGKIIRYDPLPIVVKYLPEAKEIIDRYAGKKHLLKFIEYYKNYETFKRHLYKRLRQIGKLIGYPNMHIYLARDTWATYACKAGVQETLISKGLGHVSGSIASVFYIDAGWTEIKEANIKARDYIYTNVTPRSVPAPYTLESPWKKK